MAEATHTSTVTLESEHIWEVAMNPDTGTYTGRCATLNATVVGSTWAELRASADEVTALFVEDVLDEGLEDMAHVIHYPDDPTP